MPFPMFPMEAESPPPKRQQGRELRRRDRTRLADVIYINFVGDNGGILLDLCSDGMGFQAAEPIAGQREVQFRLSTPGLEKTEIAGEIIWLDEARKRGGIKFREVPSVVRDAIAQITETGQAIAEGIRQESESVPVRAASNAVDPVDSPKPPRSQTPPPSAKPPASASIGILGLNNPRSIAEPSREPSNFLRDMHQQWHSSRNEMFGQNSTSGGRGWMAIAAAVVIFFSAGVVAAYYYGQQHAAPASLPTPTPSITQNLPVPPPDALTKNPIPPASVENQTTPVPRETGPAPTLPANSHTPTASATASRIPNQPHAGAAFNDANRTDQPSEKPVQADPQKDIALAQRYLQSAQPQEREVGIHLLWEAVGNGSSAAELELADLYLRGGGSPPKSCQQARILLRAATNSGSISADQ